VEKFLILVVDDSADNVAMLSLDLQQQGYRVVTATNGEEAITVAIRTLPNLILMDISMPRLDGLGATRRIREIEALRNVPVIAVTAHGTEGFQRAAYDVGVSGYLTKPVDFVRMHRLVAQLLAPGSGNLTGVS
jgi:CheY-like chemotaxis protein